MSHLFRGLVLTALLAAPAAFAQSSVAEQAADLPTGEPADGAAGDGVGQPYLKDSFTDWQLICIRVAEGKEPCNIQQTIFDDADNPVMRISLAPLPADAAPRAAAAEVATPLETLLREDVVLSVDGGAAKKYRYTFCTTEGCFARFALTQEEVDSFRKGAKAQLSIVPLIAPDQRAALDVSLSGFTAAFEAAAAELE